MRKLLFILFFQIFWYLFLAVVFWDINFLPQANKLRLVYMIVVTGLLLLSISISEGWWGSTPGFLNSLTHEEKKSSIKKYIGELHEELALYGEAMGLQEKITLYSLGKTYLLPGALYFKSYMEHIWQAFEDLI